MEKPTNKSNESTISTTGTTGTPLFSDNLDNMKYVNLNFMDNSETSSQAKDAALRLKSNSFDSTKVTKALPSKIQPQNITYLGQFDALRNNIESNLPEKSLKEMGFKGNEVEGWENIVQPHKANLYKLLNNMIDNHIKPNVQIRIGGVTFNCHMMVLQCYSDFFMECNNEVLIQLPEEKITPGAFMMVYDWMLAEEPLVQREGILELFNAANFLRIKDLINQCWLCLDDDVRFREDTAFLLYIEARNYSLDSLEHLMLTRICKFFLTLVSSKEFLDLNPKEVCTLLCSNTIGVNSEIEIFMSVVRWLSKNWTEREPSMLNIIKCVRFSLMPPWFLVTLNKNTDCAEIDRIVSHPEVKKMINDGISFTTTQLFYGENRDEFLHFLERYQLVAPIQRQWVFDKECSYHHRIECPNMQYVTYKSFLEYLEMIQTIGKNYWRNLELAKGNDKTIQCCVLPDCRKTNEQNLTSECIGKKSREQGVQVEVSSRQNGGQAGDATELTQTKYENLPKERRSNKTNIKSCINQSIIFSNVNYENPFPGPCTSPHEYKVNLYSNNIEHGNSLAATPQNHIVKAAGTMADDLEKVDWTDKTPLCSEFVEKAFKTAYQHSSRLGEVVEPVDGHPTQTPHSTSVSTISKNLDTQLLKNRRILIFGGVDPYCQLCPHHEAYSKLIDQPLHQQVRRKQSRVDDGGGNYSPAHAANYGDHVLYYDSDLEWKHLSCIPFGSRHHHAAVVCNGLTFVIGGTRTPLGCTKKSIYEKTVWSFDAQSLKWTLESSLPESRRDFAVVAIDDNTFKHKDGRFKEVGTGFYIIGGEGVNGKPLDSVWFYDVLQKIWTKKASLNLGRYGLTAVVVNSEIWVGGGIINARMECCGIGKDCTGKTTEIITDTVECYSLKDTHCANCDSSQSGIIKWMVSDRRLRVPRLFGRFCKNFNKEVYLIGGIGINTNNTFTSLSSVDRFDSQKGKWVHCGDINFARHGHDVVHIKNQIIVIGGVSTIANRTLASVERFCTKSLRSLTEIAELPWPLSGCAAVVL